MDRFPGLMTLLLLLCSEAPSSAAPTGSGYLPATGERRPPGTCSGLKELSCPAVSEGDKSVCRSKWTRVLDVVLAELWRTHRGSVCVCGSNAFPVQLVHRPWELLHKPVIEAESGPADDVFITSLCKQRKI